MSYQPDGHDRVARIRQVITDYLRMRDTVSENSDHVLMTDHVDLMPDLAAELQKIRVIEASLRQARGESDPSPLPRAFGRYEVRGCAGRGGFADVYVGHDTKLDCAVAIKVPRPDRFGTRYSIEQFLPEARRYARLRHPRIVRVYDVGQQDVPNRLERICMKAMAKRVGERYSTAGELAHELRALLRENPGTMGGLRVLKWVEATASAAWAGCRRSQFALLAMTLGATLAITAGVTTFAFINSKPRTNNAVPGVSFEMDRRMAELVLSLGGTVDVGIPSGPTREVNAADQLPTEPYSLRWIMMPRNPCCK
jgi:hypothetical protein